MSGRAPNPETMTQVAHATLVADVAELAKLRIVLLTAFTAGVGFVLASPAEVNYWRLTFLLLGCMLGAAGASAANQYIERDLDSVMNRTRNRPLPSGRLSPSFALAFALGSSAAGVSLLSVTTHALAAMLLALTIFLYAGVYTPLKRVTSLSTIVGAVPGAMPTLIGWAAAQHSLDFGAMSLFIIMFFWQLPHFISIGWIYRDDYAQAGMPMLTVFDASGAMSSRQTLLYSAALLASSVGPAVAQLCGVWYLLGALVLGLGLLSLSWHWMRLPSIRRAYWVFFGSLAYHALLFSLMLVDRIG
ncbi:MAG: heme o synthase [Candidatus Sumerlaeaceae bacterium]|jgi:protoheme IX farnesyltransferase